MANDELAFSAADGIRVRDNGEPLVDVRKYVPRARIFLGGDRDRREKTAYLRKSVAEMLRESQKHLPKGYTFVIRDAWRPAFVQASIYFDFVAKAKVRFPNATGSKVIEEVEKYVAPWKGLNASGHMSGGAIDLRILDGRGRRLPMRSRSLGYKDNALSDQPKLPAYLRRNRQVLFDVMLAGGLSNYPMEFWHWSYGDYQWAKRNGKKTAVYGAVSDVHGLYAGESCPCGSGKRFSDCHE